MKNKGTKPPHEIRLPELEIHGIWDKIIRWVIHIRHLYWIIGITIVFILFLIFMPHQICKDFWLSLKQQEVLISLVFIFGLVATSLIWSSGERLDVWVFMYFNMRGKRFSWLDWTMLCFTQVGNGVFAMLFALFLYLKVSELLAYELAFGTLTLWLVVELMKVLFHRTRPFNKLKGIRIIGSRAKGRSFPSGHTGQTFFMVALILHFYNVNIYLWLTLYAIALLVGITRIYIGMHYPRDVLGGAVLGTAWGIIGVIANSYIWSIGL